MNKPAHETDPLPATRDMIFQETHTLALMLAELTKGLAKTAERDDIHNQMGSVAERLGRLNAAYLGTSPNKTVEHLYLQASPPAPAEYKDHRGWTCTRTDGKKWFCTERAEEHSPMQCPNCEVVDD